MISCSGLTIWTCKSVTAHAGMTGAAPAILSELRPRLGNIGAAFRNLSAEDAAVLEDLRRRPRPRRHSLRQRDRRRLRRQGRPAPPRMRNQDARLDLSVPLAPVASVY